MTRAHVTPYQMSYRINTSGGHKWETAWLGLRRRAYVRVRAHIRDGYFRERLHVRGDRPEPVHAHGHQLLPF